MFNTEYYQYLYKLLDYEYESLMKVFLDTEEDPLLAVITDALSICLSTLELLAERDADMEDKDA